MKNILPLILFCLSVLFSSAQNVGGQDRYCYTDEIWARMVRDDSSLLVKRRKMDETISKYSNQTLSQNGNRPKSLPVTTPIVIPTVIYVVYDTPTVNISMAQIQSQMDQLNQNMAAYGYTFCYAKRNVTDTSYFVPHAGDSAGVFRIQSPLSNVNDYTTDAQLKALSILPWQNYLRIFIVHSITPQGVLGYTIMPGSNSPQDGIVMRYDVSGSNNFCSLCQLYPTYNLGAALTHEVGHYLDLYHTFQGGCDTGTGSRACTVFGDWVCDTPPTDGSFGCPSPAPLSCDGVNHELIQNYMDYTDDPCKNSFTPGQKARMDYAVQAYRSVLISTQNLINTGVSCVNLGNQYANFYCANYDGCQNMPMTFASLASPGFVYSWDFGDGTTGTGDTVQHTYTGTGEYMVSLNAVNTSQNINATSSTPVFITSCSPISCSLNKWDFEYGYMDFSSGTPVATNHTPEYPNPSMADFYYCYYRADNADNPLFHIGPRSVGSPYLPFTGLLDSSFNIVDSFGIGGYYTLVPVPGHTNTFCLIGNSAHDSLEFLNGLDTLDYSIIDAQNGSPRVLPGKKLINFPFPAGFNYSLHDLILTAGIPGCDGGKLWIIVNPAGSNGFYVFQLDSSETLNFHQYYAISPPNMQPYGMVPSTDGRKIAIDAEYSTGGDYSLLILNFDKSSGNITGYDTVYTHTTKFVGVSDFSPNSRFLYEIEQPVITNNYTESLYQYDLYNPHSYTARMLVNQCNINGIGQCYKGPDQKMYIGFQTDPPAGIGAYRLAVINTPDILDNGLNNVGFNINGPDIRPANCPYSGINWVGFSTFCDYTNAYGCSWQPNVPNPFSYYANGCLNYQFYSDQCFTASWTFGDPASGGANSSTLNAPVHNFSRPGTYVVRLLTNGYTFTDTIHIAAPSPQIASTPCPTLYANYSIANIQPFVNYIWTVTNGTPSSAQAQNNINVNWNAADTSGKIMVIAIDTVMGCIDTVMLNIAYNNNCPPLDIGNINFENQIYLYPNPANNMIEAESGLFANADTRAFVYDVTGRLISVPATASSGKITFDISALADGVYSIKFVIKEQEASKRFVKIE